MIKRSKRDRNYSVIDNEVYKEKVLTWEAQGLLSNILSKPDNWSVLPTALVKATEGTRKQSKINSIYIILRELKDEGFAEMKRFGSGKVQYTVYDTPKRIANPSDENQDKAEDKPHPVNDNPKEDNPKEDNPSEDNHHDIVSTNTLTNTNNSESTDFIYAEEDLELDIVREHSLCIPEQLPTGLTANVIEEFIQHRFGLNKPLTQKQLAICIREAHRIGVELKISADEILLEAISASWATFKLDWMRNRFPSANNHRQSKPQATFQDYAAQAERLIEAGRI